MSCPYCGKKDYIPDYVVLNIESYGSSIIRFPCLKCKKTVKAFASRKVVLASVRQTDEESDW